MVERFDSWIRLLGPWGYWALGLAAFIEYVFPPFPGDSVVLLGGIYAARGQRPWPWVLLAVTLGSIAGAAADFWVGTRLAAQLERGGRVTKWAERLRPIQERMRRRGALLLLVNRFLPGVRGFVFYAAGASRMRLGPVLAWGGASALVFNSVVLSLGFALGGNIERLESVFLRYQRLAGGLVTIALLALVIRWIAARRRSKVAP